MKMSKMMDDLPETPNDERPKGKPKANAKISLKRSRPFETEEISASRMLSPNILTPESEFLIPCRIPSFNLASRLNSNPSVSGALSNLLSPSLSPLSSLDSTFDSDHIDVDEGRKQRQETEGRRRREEEEREEEEERRKLEETTTMMMTMRKKKARESLRLMMIEIAEIVRSIHRFDCETAIRKIDSLPLHHRQSGSIQTLLAQSHIELCNYHQANEIFQSIRRKDPYLVAGMESFSTVLWHLRKDVELSHLAQQLVQFDRLSPQAWCVVGNWFSLQNDHESAIKMFQRV